MEEELAVLREAMEQMKREITLVAAESLALQYILTMMASNLANAYPPMRPIILQAFDSAANVAEHLSIEQGPRSGHVPETLRIIEQLRSALTGAAKPTHGV
jgi:hypothetical protein